MWLCGFKRAHYFSNSLIAVLPIQIKCRSAAALIMLLFMYLPSAVAFEPESNARQGLPHRPLGLVHFLERDVCFSLSASTQGDHLSFSPTNETKAPCIA
jgi:hypothetical protein